MLHCSECTRPRHIRKMVHVPTGLHLFLREMDLQITKSISWHGLKEWSDCDGPITDVDAESLELPTSSEFQMQCVGVGKLTSPNYSSLASKRKEKMN